MYIPGHHLFFSVLPEGGNDTSCFAEKIEWQCSAPDIWIRIATGRLVMACPVRFTASARARAGKDCDGPSVFT